MLLLLCILDGWISGPYQVDSRTDDGWNWCAGHDPNPEAPAQAWYNQQQQQQPPFVLWQPGCEQMVAPWPWQPSAWHYAPPPSLIPSPPTPTFWQYPTYSWSPPANSPNCNCYYCHHAPAMSSYCYPPAWSTEASPHMDDAPPPRRQQQQPSDTTHRLNRPLKHEGRHFHRITCCRSLCGVIRLPIGSDSSPSQK